MKKETSDIVRFYHCKKCLASIPLGESPASWARLSVGFSKEGIQVWCERHQLNVLHLDFHGQKVGIVPMQMEPKKKMWKIQDQSARGDWGDIKSCDDDTGVYKDCFYETKKEAMADAKEMGHPEKGYRVVSSDIPSRFDFY